MAVFYVVSSLVLVCLGLFALYMTKAGNATVGRVAYLLLYLGIGGACLFLVSSNAYMKIGWLYFGWIQAFLARQVRLMVFFIIVSLVVVVLYASVVIVPLSLFPLYFSLYVTLYFLKTVRAMEFRQQQTLVAVNGLNCFLQGADLISFVYQVFYLEALWSVSFWGTHGPYLQLMVFLLACGCLFAVFNEGKRLFLVSTLLLLGCYVTINVATFLGEESMLPDSLFATEAKGFPYLPWMVITCIYNICRWKFIGKKLEGVEVFA